MVLKKQGEHIAANKPRQTARAPTDRHYVTRITTTTMVKSQTTFIEPWVDVKADLRAINEGRAVRDGSRFTVNGRTYEQEEHGTLFPVRGKGFTAPMPRPVVNALKAYARYNGINAQSEHEVTSMKTTDKHRREARRIWRMRERAKQ